MGCPPLTVPTFNFVRDASTLRMDRLAWVASSDKSLQEIAGPQEQGLMRQPAISFIATHPQRDGNSGMHILPN